MTMKRFYVALLQVDTQQYKRENLRKIGSFIDEAASRGAHFISLPEMTTYIGDHEGALKNGESIPGKTTEFLAAKAREHNIWIHGGSIYESTPHADKLFNTTVVYSPQGEIKAVYRKIHLYDVDVIDGIAYKESDTIKAGEDIVTFDTEFCRMGLAICYDIRFPELYRILMLRGAKVIFNPAEFALYTGKDHWESLLRARAIENQCYMVCTDQIGVKPTMHTFGRSLVVDPWGNTIAKASDKECVLMVEIDIDYLNRLREQVPCLSNRKPATYKW